MSKPLFEVFFKDGSFFIGGDNYFDSKWLEIPKNKKIKFLYYRLPDGNKLMLQNYDKYFHMVEAVMDLSGKERGKTKIEYAYIVGLKNEEVKSYRITLLSKQNDRYKLGDITVRTFTEKEFIKKVNINNWRPLLNEL